MLRNYRWLIVFLLFTATTINYVDRQIIGLLKPILEKEFNWSETDFAHIVMAFQAAYAVGLLGFGWVIDKIGTKVGYAVTIVIWSLAGMLHAVARSVTGFSLARIGLGLGEAGNYPAAVKTVAEWFPKRTGTGHGSVQCRHEHWRSGSGVDCALDFKSVRLARGILDYRRFRVRVAYFLATLYDIPEKQTRLTPQERSYILSGQEDVASEPDAKSAVNWFKLFTFPQTWAYITGKGLIDPIYWFFLFWLPSYFSATFSLDLKKPSPELMLIYLATTVGSIGGGYLSSSLIKRGWPTIKARKTVLLALGTLELSIILTQFATDRWVAVGLISLAVALHQAWATNVFTLASDMFPKQAVSSVVGIGGTAGALGGIFFPMLVGNLLDQYKAAGNLTGGYNVLFTICGFTYLISWVIIHLLTRKGNVVESSELTDVSPIPSST